MGQCNTGSKSTRRSLGQVQLIGFDNGDSITGFALPQTSSLSLSALTGNWSFFLSGSSGSTTIVDARRFTLDSSGNITLGAEDQNSGGAVSSNATRAPRQLYRQMDVVQPLSPARYELPILHSMQTHRIRFTSSRLILGLSYWAPHISNRVQASLMQRLVELMSFFLLVRTASNILSLG